MKYIIFSFDDGLSDFKEFALPILQKFNFKCSINVISGYSDNTINVEGSYLSIEDIKELKKNGYEISNHTDSHSRGSSYNDLMLCDEKIKKWCNTNENIGIVMPKYVKPSSDALIFIKLSKPSYLTFEKRLYAPYFRINALISRINYLIKHDEESFYEYSHALKSYKKGKTFYFRRFTVGPSVNPMVLFSSLHSIKNNHCITICFHSIVKNVNECDYPKGAWTPNQFYSFCKLLKEHNDEFAVITQLEACK